MTEKITYGIIAKTKQWFEEAVPTPTKQNQSVQLGCHLEETLEMLDSIDIPTHQYQLTAAKQALEVLSNILKKDVSVVLTIRDRKEFLDAVADQLVTATGCGHVFGMDVVGALNEVNESNWSKFENGKAVFNEHGKIRKGINYREPVLSPYLGKDPTDLLH